MIDLKARAVAHISCREQVTFCQLSHVVNKLHFVSYLMSWTSYILSAISCCVQVTFCQLSHVVNKLHFVSYLMSWTSYILSVISCCVQVTFCQLSHVVNKLHFVSYLMSSKSYILSVISCHEQVTFWWDDNDARFILDQYAVGFHSASLLIKPSVGRRVIPLGHIIRIPSPPVFALFP